MKPGKHISISTRRSPARRISARRSPARRSPLSADTTAHYTQNQSDFETIVNTTTKMAAVHRTDTMKVVWKGKYTRLFVGKHHNYADRWTAKEGSDPGNTLLFLLPSGKYLFVGFNVVEYTLPETITKYESNVGNSSFPYPVAYGRTHAYLMIEKASLPKTALARNQDPYQVYYRDKTTGRSVRHRIIAKH